MRRDERKGKEYKSKLRSLPNESPSWLLGDYSNILTDSLVVYWVCCRNCNLEMFIQPKSLTPEKCIQCGGQKCPSYASVVPHSTNQRSREVQNLFGHLNSNGSTACSYIYIYFCFVFFVFGLCRGKIHTLN